MRAAGRDPLRRGPQHFDGAGLQEATLLALHASADPLARQGPIDEDDQAVETRHAAAFHGGAFDVEFDFVPGLRFHPAARTLESCRFPSQRD